MKKKFLVILMIVFAFSAFVFSVYAVDSGGMYIDTDLLFYSSIKAIDGDWWNPWSYDSVQAETTTGYVNNNIPQFGANYTETVQAEMLYSSGGINYSTLGSVVSRSGAWEYLNVSTTIYSTATTNTKNGVSGFGYHTATKGQTYYLYTDKNF